MSLIGTAIAINKGIGLATSIKSAFGGLFGGGGGGSKENIARITSKMVGCTILQKDEKQARAMWHRGVNPCTGRARNAAEAFDTGIPNRTVTLDPRFQGGRIPGSQPIPIGLPTTVSDIPNAAGRIPPFTPSNGGFQPAMASLGSVMRLGGTRALMGPGVARTATGRISSVVLPSGQRFSRKKAAALIRRVGFEAAAAALGIGIYEAAELLLADTGTRRRRGITGAQLTSAKRVITTIDRMHKQICCTTPRRAPARRTTKCR